MTEERIVSRPGLSGQTDEMTDAVLDQVAGGQGSTTTSTSGATKTPSKVVIAIIAILIG
jgi:hypothetical protein